MPPATGISARWNSGDYILLCTDGLVNTVTDQEMLFEIIHGGDLDTCLERLLEISKSQGAPDNVTAVLMQKLVREGETNGPIYRKNAG